MSWLFSRALVVEYSAANCSDGEPCAQLSVMPTQRPFWHKDRTMEASTHSLFGVTWKPLTGQSGVELLTWYLAGFRARTSALQGKVRASRATGAGSGRSSRASLARFDPGTHSLRTAQCSLFEDSTECCATLPRWGSMLAGAVYQDSIPDMKRTATGFGLLRRPLWTDHKFYVLTKRQMVTRRAQSKTPMNWMQQAIELSDLSKAWANVRFAEHLMRWPIGWTDLEPLAMAKTHTSLQRHGGC